MTYQEFRAFGYTSRLSRLRCGLSSTEKQAEDTQISASQQQMELAQSQEQLQSQQYNQYQQDIQPLQAQLTALSTGDRSAALSAAMPVVQQQTAGFNAAKANIMNTMPAGAARDTALANLETQKATNIGATEANLVQQAPQQLAALGSGIGSMSLQQLGAAFSGLSGASTSSSQVAQEENAAQQNKVGMISGLANMAGTAAGGALTSGTSLSKIFS
jgi:hypothetical protein